VAYNSLLFERRKLLHQRAGRALESMFAEQLEEHVTQLAHHYSHSADSKKALHYLQRAAQYAVQRGQGRSNCSSRNGTGPGGNLVQ
jgi:tRNA A37 N6-isopentenylltransferase MiaA